jgi:hypothetical protein
VNVVDLLPGKLAHHPFDLAAGCFLSDVQKVGDVVPFDLDVQVEVLDRALDAVVSRRHEETVAEFSIVQSISHVRETGPTQSNSPSRNPLKLPACRRGANSVEEAAAALGSFMQRQTEALADAFYVVFTINQAAVDQYRLQGKGKPLQEQEVGIAAFPSSLMLIGEDRTRLENTIGKLKKQTALLERTAATRSRCRSPGRRTRRMRVKSNCRSAS